MNNIYYVYQYLSPLTGDPFYIGMGHGNRKDYHLKEAEKYLANKLNKKSRNLLKINTIVKLLRANILPIITIIEEHLTNYIQAKHILTGEIKRLKKDSVEWLSGEYEGVMKNFKHAPRTEEHKEKLRQANLNKTISENTKLKMSSSKKGLNYFTNETLKTYTRAREDSLNVEGYIRKKPAAKELKNYTYIKFQDLIS